MEKNTQRFITKHTPHRIENIGTLDVIPKCKKYLVKRTTNNHLYPIYNFTFVLFGFSIFCVFITYIKGYKIDIELKNGQNKNSVEIKPFYKMNEINLWFLRRNKNVFFFN